MEILGDKLFIFKDRVVLLCEAKSNNEVLSYQTKGWDDQGGIISEPTYTDRWKIIWTNQDLLNKWFRPKRGQKYYNPGQVFDDVHKAHTNNGVEEHALSEGDRVTVQQMRSCQSWERSQRRTKQKAREEAVHA